MYAFTVITQNNYKDFLMTTKNIKIFIILCTMISTGNLYSDKLEFICTGDIAEFTLLVDLTSKELIIKTQDGEASKKNPNPRNLPMCPNLFWETDITEKMFEIIMKCNVEHEGSKFQFNREDGTYKQSSEATSLNGICVKSPK